MTDALTARSSASPLRRIGSLAAPALVVLAAEPLYVLVDTAVVGHLGRVPLAALAIGGTVLSLATLLGNFLAYGTTGRSARHYGAGNRVAAVGEGVQASWLAFGFGVTFVLVLQVAAGPVARLLAGGGPQAAEVAAGAQTWVQVASFGAPGILLTLAGNGWLRGVRHVVRPMRYVLAANVLSAVLCPLLVYPAGLGLTGSAIANVVAQLASAGLFLRALTTERVPLRPRLPVLVAQLRLGRDLVLRTVGFQACFISATAVAARFGPAALGAHQIALQLWFFCVFVLDAVAIAAQSLIGAELGAGRVHAARGTARRVAGLGGAAGLLLGAGIGGGAYGLPRLFTGDDEVLGQALLAWPWFAGMMPLAGVVFALDGVLIGAGDVRFLRNVTVLATLGVFLPAIWLAYWLELGLGGIWAGLAALIVVRFVAMSIRTARGRWAVPGVV